MKNSLEDLFKNKDLLTLAFTHKSWVNEHSSHKEFNERVEFLGDAILEFVVSRAIYEMFPDKEEGYLTALRANLVNTVNLSEIAKKLEFGKKLLLSKGEEETGGRENPSILADTVEAVIGALFLDSGLKAVENFINENLLSMIGEKLEKPLKDAKSRLQEYVQAQGLPAPHYQVVNESGPDHAKVFTIEALVGSESWGTGNGKNKSEAAQEAAKAALELYSQKFVDSQK